MSTPIKRLPRTYGRPKDAVVEEPMPSFQPSEAWSLESTTHRTGGLHLAQKSPRKPNVSRQSPDPDVADGQQSDVEVDDASNSYQFGWRAKLKEMDEEEPADGDDSAVLDAEDASHAAPHRSSRHSPEIVPDNDVPRTVPNSPSLQQSPPMVQDVFGGSLSTLTASSATSEAFDAFESHSPPASPPILTHRRVKQRAIVHTSDEDSEDDTKRSPVVIHPITTPKSRPSSTPPTSDDDEMPARIASNSRSKGKRKASTSRAQVPALQFNDESGVNHRKRPSETLPAHAKSKLKAPTKKEKLETIRDRGRIAGGQKAAVQRADVSNRNNLSNFFQMVQGASLVRTSSDLDPISSFSSSPGPHRTTSTTVEFVEAPPTPAPFPQANEATNTTQLRALDAESDDENLPDVGDILKVVKKDKSHAEKQKELMAMKLLLAAKTRPTVSVHDDDDDELEITGPDELKAKDIIAERGSGSKPRPSEGRKRQMMLGGISVAQQRSKQKATPPKPLALGSSMWSQAELLKEMAQRVAQTNADITNQKEQEWVKRGGKEVEVVGDADNISTLRSAALKEYAEKGRMNAEAREARMQVDLEDDDDDAEDEDWYETRGSAGPRRQEDSDADVEDANATMVNEDEDEDGDEENQAPVQLKTRAPRRTRAVLDSDNENEENAAPLGKSAPLILRESIFGRDEDLVSPTELAGAAIHRGSISSMDERTEDEGDKENSTHLMYDKSEDKENKAVPRHPFGARPPLARQGSLFGLEGRMERGLSMSPGEQEPMSDGGDDQNENDAGGDRRRPLQNLLADEDPFLAEPGPSAGVDFTARLQQASPLSGQLLDTPQSTLQGSFEASGAPLQPGFSELFESGTEEQRPKRALRFSASFSEKSDVGLFALRQTAGSLGLTQDVDLQPAFEVGDHLKRQADAIFEKEQEYLWEAANRKTDKKQDLYVNDHGFLTQTRPDVEDPEIYRPSSPSQAASFSGTQRSGLLDPQSSLRRPLRTLSLTESVELDAPEPSPLRRLTKRTRTPSPRSNRSSPSPSPAMRTKDAFEMLRRDKLGIRAPRPKKPLEKSEYVAEEAQESDDDEMLGLGKRDDGEEEDGEDMDQTLVTLVDDQEIDEETLAAARVLEKYQEQTHEDDLAIEKLHQGVVQGELRKKRRNRGLLDDSDEEDEEDEMRKKKIRRSLREPKIDRDDINDLANDQRTEPFYQVYRADLEPGDDLEFAHLQETQPETTEDAEMGSDDENAREILTRKELTEKLREVARREQVEPEMNVDDVSWVDGDDSDGEGQTKINTISLQRGRSARNAGESGEHERMHQWAKTEGRSRNVGALRASGRTAVTGQKAKAKTGGGSLRTGVQPTGKPAEARKGLKMQPSFLAGVASDRSGRFV
ncbi:hypothetical protein C8R44DRAFT_875967 [Mycena epipterygia]|nr:hypothetical protein C8R44DRAFT_875967 [Mycena epipterygia]